MSETNLAKGHEMRRTLLGDAYVDNMAASTYKDPLMRKFIDLVSETVFASMWTRPGLDLKIRTLVTVISDASTGREPELAIHLRMARRQGWSEEEIAEAVYITALFAFFNRVADAFGIPPMGYLKPKGTR